MNGSGKYCICIVVVHNKEANIAVEQHKGEVSGAVVVDNASSFVDKRIKAEDVGN
jgi:hypothetical protein